MDEKKPEPTKLQTDYTFERMQNEIDRLTTENNRLKRENIDSSNVLFANTNACQALQAEIAEYKITCPKCTYSKHKELQAELAEAQKKPEPGEFTKKARQEWKDTANIHSKPYRWCLEACDIIDRLTTELKELVSANPDCCWRKCHDCGRTQIHHESVTPGVLCRFCGSQDTRLLKKETQALKGE